MPVWLITRVLFALMHDGGAVRYRQEVFQDLENPALFGELQRFSEPFGEVRANLAVKDPLPTSFGEDLYYRLGGWLEETEPYP